MLTLVSWNIQYGKGVDGRIDLSRMVEVIHQDGLPDVLCLQEVSRNDPDTANGSDQVKELQILFPDYEIISELPAPSVFSSGTIMCGSVIYFVVRK